MEIGSNWKFLITVYVLTSGVWGFILKIASTRLDWKTMIFYAWMTVFILYTIFVFKDIKFGWSKFHFLSILAGVLGTIGTVGFYKAISLAPASIVIPFSAQYVLITVLLCVLFLKEPLSLRIIAGIACSIAAIVLLSR